MMYIQLGIMAASWIAKMIADNKKKNRDAKNAAATTADDQGIRQQQTQQQALMQALSGQAAEGGRNAGLDLQRRQFSLEAPRERGKQALFGSMLQNLQPARLSGGSPQMLARMPRFSGGMSPSAISPQARQMGALMQSNAVRGQQAGDNFAPLPQTNFAGGVLDPKTMTPHQQSGTMESLLGLLGMVGSAYGQYRTGAFGSLGAAATGVGGGKYDYSPPVAPGKG